MERLVVLSVARSLRLFVRLFVRRFVVRLTLPPATTPRSADTSTTVVIYRRSVGAVAYTTTQRSTYSQSVVNQSSRVQLH